MKKGLTALIFMLMIAALTFAVAGCSGGEDSDDGIRVVYELEGGTFKNSAGPIELSYSFAEGAKRVIKPLEFKQFGELTKAGYRIEGWYKTKTVNGDETVYSDKWDFENDVVPDGGVTLYARWMLNVSYSYEIGYYDGDTFVIVGTYKTSPDIPFGERKQNVLTLANKREGFTATGRFFEDKEMTVAFDDKFAFAESEEDCAVKVVAEYVEGKYKIISDASDFESSDGEYEGRTLYILSDVDLSESDIDTVSLFEKNDEGVPRYEGIVGADGVKTISGITVNADFLNAYSDVAFDDAETEVGNLRVSLFGEIDGITFKNVRFTDVKVSVKADHDDIKIVYFAPLALKAENCTFENVEISVTSYTVVIGIKDPGDVGYKESVTTDGVWAASFTDVSGVTVTVCDKTERGYGDY